MMFTATIGAYVGTRPVRKLPAKKVKSVVVMVGLLMAIAFFVL